MIKSHLLIRNFIFKMKYLLIFDFNTRIRYISSIHEIGEITRTLYQKIWHLPKVYNLLQSFPKKFWL